MTNLCLCSARWRDTHHSTHPRLFNDMGPVLVCSKKKEIPVLLEVSQPCTRLGRWNHPIVYYNSTPRFTRIQEIPLLLETHYNIIPKIKIHGWYLSVNDRTNRRCDLYKMLMTVTTSWIRDARSGASNCFICRQQRMIKQPMYLLVMSTNANWRQIKLMPDFASFRFAVTYLSNTKHNCQIVSELRIWFTEIRTILKLGVP